MADKYDTNGDYPGYEGSGSSDFKRKNSVKRETVDPEEKTTPADKAHEYVRELLAEKLNLDHKWPHSLRLIEQEVVRVQADGKVPPRENRYVDIYREKPIKVSVKVLVPVREHPKFNFVGKLLGPKGNSMKRLQEDTMCKMAVLGRGSMKDRQKEEELRAALDPKYAHLGDDLHVEISALGPPAEAHARIAYALAEVRKYLIPDNNDIIRQEQMREMMTEPEAAEAAEEAAASARAGYRPRTAPAARTGLMSSRGSARPARTATLGPVGVGPRSPVPTPRVMPAKTKILSILDRARAAMEESYGYEDAGAAPTYESSYPVADTYTYVPPTSRARYTAPEYEPEYHGEYYRRTEYEEEPTSTRWKYSSSKSRDEEAGSSSRHASTRDSRYRSSPYSRPSK